MTALSYVIALLMLAKPEYSFASEIYCDIVIGGGNSGALSAAISAAQFAEAQNKNVSICLLEPTDWPGGQMTAQGVSELDYGPYNTKSQNQPKSFQRMRQILGNPGDCDCNDCITCYEPQHLINKYIFPTLYNLSEYITVYYRTVITNTFNTSNNINGNKYITSVSAIQRKPINPSKEWKYLFSQQIQDWYSPINSSLFTKTKHIFSAKIFIEGTEFNDITMTSGIKIFQGAETPYENSTTTNQKCGQ
eukprot:244629_1